MKFTCLLQDYQLVPFTNSALNNRHIFYFFICLFVFFFLGTSIISDMKGGRNI